jgi:tight adherence protein B
MPRLELILLVSGLAVPLALGLFRLERTERRRRILRRTAFLSGRREAPPLLSFIPWRELGSVEIRMAGLAVFLSLVIAFMFALPIWLILAQLAVICPLAWYVARRCRLARLRARFAERFPEAVDSLTRAVRSGVPVDRALASLGDIFDGVMADRFRRLVRQLELGVPFRDALRNFSRSLDLPDVDYFCSVLALNRESGSPLSPMLITLGRTLRERQAVDRKLRGLTSESRAAATVLSFLPLIIIGLQAFLNPGQFAFLLGDPTGRLVLGYSTISIVAGLLIIRRMSRLLEA